MRTIKMKNGIVAPEKKKTTIFFFIFLFNPGLIELSFIFYALSMSTYLFRDLFKLYDT